LGEVKSVDPIAGHLEVSAKVAGSVVAAMAELPAKANATSTMAEIPDDMVLFTSFSYPYEISRLYPTPDR
jgi:hypothetical protein